MNIKSIPAISRVAEISRVTVSALAESDFEEACPPCGEVLLRSHDGCLEVPHGAYYFDGETIPGAASEPSGGGPISATAFALEVGGCARCQTDLVQINGQHASVPVDLNAWCRIEARQRHYFVVNAELSCGRALRWLMTEFRSSDGWYRQDHSFGPLLLSAREAGRLRGPYGIGACSGGGKSVWQRAARLAGALDPWLRQCLALTQ